jgi:hypothetical protein
LSEKELKEFLVKYVDEMAEKFRNPRNRIQMTKHALDNSPDKAGVYGVYDKGVLINVGETKCLSERMSQIFKTRNHTFRRSLGKFLFADCDDYTKDSSKKGFCERIENELNIYAAQNLIVFLLPVLVGRKEIEERVIDNFDGLLNQ